MKRVLYVMLGLLTLTACQQQDEFLEQEECVLKLDITCAHVPVVVTRAIDADLAVTILDATGKVYKRIAAGEVSSEIPMRAGSFTVCVHTDNLTTWHEANGGRGEPCYYGSKEVTLQSGERGNLSISVPMTNYAVGLELPESFDELFTSHQLRLKSGTREVVIHEGEKAYFDVADEGFTHALSATNIDGVTHSYPPKLFASAQSGRCYLITYSYGVDDVLNVHVRD